MARQLMNSQVALNSLKAMVGWEEDGFATGTNDKDVYYAVDHDFEDINDKILLKLQ